MKPSSFYPVICTEKIDESTRFYTEHFKFEITFESDWYVSLKTKGQPSFELALLNPEHPTVPEDFRKPLNGGLLLNFEVDDVDQEYDQLKSAGLPIIMGIKDEAFGQRHFITADPNGVLLDVIKVIPPSEEFAAQYVE